MACSKDAATSKMTVEEGMYKMCEKLDYTLQYLHTLAEKIANMELRQSQTAGQDNDSVRALDSWCKAESSCVAAQALKSVNAMLKVNKQLNLATYFESFVQKDERRCEYQLWKFYELMFCKNTFVASDSQHAQGSAFMKMPSVIRKLNPEITDEEVDKLIPEPLKLLYQLLMPINRANKVMTIQKMIEVKVVPQDYKSKYPQLTEDQAKAIWDKIKALQPECKMVEEIPLHEMHLKGNWQQQLIARVIEYNIHKKKVSDAEAVASWEVESEGETMTDEQKKLAKEKHSKALEKFWTAKDASGLLVITKSRELKKKWDKQAKEAENEKAKKAKVENEKAESEKSDE